MTISIVNGYIEYMVIQNKHSSVCTDNISLSDMTIIIKFIMAHDFWQRKSINKRYTSKINSFAKKKNNNNTKAFVHKQNK